MMWASFLFVGNCPVLKRHTGYNSKGFLSSSLNSFNINFGIELGPVAFLALREIMILLISFSVMSLEEMKLSFGFLNNLKISFLILVFLCLYFLQ